MRILRNPPLQNPPILQNRNIRILRVIANRNAHSPHLLLHRQRVPFSTRFFPRRYVAAVLRPASEPQGSVPRFSLSFRTRRILAV